MSDECEHLLSDLELLLFDREGASSIEDILYIARKRCQQPQVRDRALCTPKIVDTLGLLIGAGSVEKAAASMAICLDLASSPCGGKANAKILAKSSVIVGNALKAAQKFISKDRWHRKTGLCCETANLLLTTLSPHMNSVPPMLLRLAPNVNERATKWIHMWAENGQLCRSSSISSRCLDPPSRAAAVKSATTNMAFIAGKVFSSGCKLALALRSHCSDLDRCLLVSKDTSKSKDACNFVVWHAAQALSECASLQCGATSPLLPTMQCLTFISEIPSSNDTFAVCARNECMAYLRRHFCQRVNVGRAARLLATMSFTGLSEDAATYSRSLHWAPRPEVPGNTLLEAALSQLDAGCAVSWRGAQTVYFCGGDIPARNIREFILSVLENALLVCDGFYDKCILKASPRSLRIRKRFEGGASEAKLSAERPRTAGAAMPDPMICGQLRRPQRPSSFLVQSPCAQALAIVSSAAKGTEIARASAAVLQRIVIKSQKDKNAIEAFVESLALFSDERKNMNLS